MPRSAKAASTVRKLKSPKAAVWAQGMKEVNRAGRKRRKTR